MPKNQLSPRQRIQKKRKSFSSGHFQDQHRSEELNHFFTFTRKAKQKQNHKDLNTAAQYYLQNRNKLHSQFGIERLIHVANQLSISSSPACEQACATIAQKCNFAGLTLKHYAMSIALLSNACSKGKHVISQKAIAHIVKNIKAERLNEFGPQNLALLANACSKLVGDKSCEQLIVKIANHILHSSRTGRPEALCCSSG